MTQIITDPQRLANALYRLWSRPSSIITHQGVDFSSSFGSALAVRAYARARGVRLATRHPTFGRVLAKTHCGKTSAK